MTRDERRGGLIDGTRLAREHAAEKEARARRRWMIRRAVANVLYLGAAALCVVSLLLADGLGWFAGALMVVICGAFVQPDGGA
jgi:hypothetical protein